MALVQRRLRSGFPRFLPLRPPRRSGIRPPSKPRCTMPRSAQMTGRFCRSWGGQLDAAALERRWRKFVCGGNGFFQAQAHRRSSAMPLVRMKPVFGSANHLLPRMRASIWNVWDVARPSPCSPLWAEHLGGSQGLWSHSMATTGPATKRAKRGAYGSARPSRPPHQDFPQPGLCRYLGNLRDAAGFLQ